MRHKHSYKTICWTRTMDPETGKLYKVTLDIDEAGILDVLGYKALRSKGGEARECNGDIRVRARAEEA